MKYGYDTNKPALQKRLSRIEGQVRGIAGMVEDDRYCIDILTQITAARAALDTVALELVRDHTVHCMSSTDPDEREQKAKEITTALARMLKV